MAKRATYYRDETEGEPNGIVVVETGELGVLVTERRGSDWSKPFWMPEFEFNTVVEGVATRVGILENAKFEGILKVAQ